MIDGATSDGTGAPVAPTDGARPRRDLLTVVIPALLAYVPLLLTSPGVVGADTKTYLYLDPGKLLADAPYVWDAQIGMGTVTHQNIGYLFPMGPFYWLLDAVGLPDWVAQRLWLASVLFAAGMGVRFLARTVGWGRDRALRGGLLVAVLAYMLSPYFLAYAARISVILLPWAALPWLIALTARAVRRGGWRDPAWFAFVVLVVGGINATALLLVGLGPALWLVHAVVFEREATWREALAAAARIGTLTVVTSLWWIAGLWAEGRYGLPVTRYTETYRTVAEVSNAPEVLRGLGYWFFYGNDKLGPWIEPSIDYTQRVPLLALSYALPTAALAGAALLRWRHRAFFLALLVVGALAAIGAHPWDGPSVLGGLFKAFTRTDAGLSLRSTPRAVPLVVLATSVLAGSSVAALGRRIPRAAVPTAALACVLIVVNLPPLWRGGLVADNLQRDEDLPSYWPEAAAWLDQRGDGTRVLEVPGSDFASYRWGNTVDPITPGLIERPYVARELFQWGSPQSADLLNAFDRRLHEETMDPEAIATVARLLGVGDVVARNDLQYERFRVARPRQLWDLLRATPGLEAPIGFGDVVPNVAGPEQTMVDEVELGTPVDLAWPPPVGVFPVEDPLPIVRTHVAEHPVLAAADGDGVVDAAAAGVLDADQALFSSAWFAEDPVGFATVYDQGADLVVTDTNRRRAHRWGSLRETTGYTERAGEEPGEYDPSDQRLEVFPAADDDHATVTELRVRDDPGITTGATVTASGYGNPITFTPDDRPVLALDGDPVTAWRVGAIDEARGESITIELDEPVTTDEINLLQPITLERTRWITEARLHLDDGGPPVDVTLDERSRAESAEGQTVVLPTERTFSTLEIEVVDTNIAERPRYEGISGVGFAEVRIPGVGIEEVVRPPTALLDRAGPSSIEHRLVWVLTRLRSNPAEPVRGDEEQSLRRALQLPTDRDVSLEGQARLSAELDDAAVDRLLGLPGPDEGGVAATSSTRLPGALDHRASAALDGDPTTSWTGTFQQQTDAFLRIETGEPVTFDRLDLQVVADGRHSVPTRIRIEAAVGDEPLVPVAGLDLPPIVDQAEPGATTSIPLALPAEVTADHLLVVVEHVRQVPTRDWYSNGPTILPLAIAELGIPGVAVDRPEGELDSGCRDDLVQVDGTPVPARIRGDVDDALARRVLSLRACVDDVALTAGDHVVRTGAGRTTGFDVDRLVLASAAGGAALAPDELPRDVPPGPAVTVTDDGRVSTEAEVDAGGSPFWFVLGASWSDGWSANADGADLGPPVLAAGYANGWLVEPTDDGPVEVSVAWTPQRVVWWALGLSAVAAVACLGLMVLARRRRPRHEHAPGTADFPDAPSLLWPPLAPRPVLPWTVAGPVLAFVAAVVALDVPLGPSGLVALPVVGLAVATLRWRRGQRLATWAAAASLGLAGAYVVVQQYRHRFPPDFVWPTEFDRVHALGLAAVLLVGVQVVRDLADRRREAHDDHGDPEVGGDGPVVPPPAADDVRT